MISGAFHPAASLGAAPQSDSRSCLTSASGRPPGPASGSSPASAAPNAFPLPRMTFTEARSLAAIHGLVRELAARLHTSADVMRVTGTAVGAALAGLTPGAGPGARPLADVGHV